MSDLARGARRREQRDTQPGGNGRVDLQPSEDGRPRIRVRDDDLTVLLDEAWEAIRQYNAEEPRVFRRGGALVDVAADDRGEPAARDLVAEALLEHLGHAAYFYRVRKGKDGPEEFPAKPPIDIAKVMLVTPRGAAHQLYQIVRAPVVAPSGRIVTCAGYDAETHIYYAPGTLMVPPIPETPSPHEISAAVALFMDHMLVDFPFGDQADKANALAFILLPFARSIIGDHPTPLHLFDKSSPGAGGTLLLSAVGRMVCGVPPAFLTEGRDEDERKKRLLALFMTSPVLVVLDNIQRFDSPTYNAALTTPYLSDRLLGASRMAGVAIRCTWAASGNNVAVAAEGARRVVSIRLVPPTDRPWERPATEFKHPRLLEWVAENRAQLVAAALTIIRAWFARGCPDGRVSLGSYERWSGVMGGLLDVAGVAGFLDNRTNFYERADAESGAWRLFLGSWWDRHHDAEVGVSDLWRMLVPESDQIEAVEPPCDLGRGSEKSQRTRLGIALARMVDRRFSVADRVLCIRCGTVRHNSRTFKLSAGGPGGPGERLPPLPGNTTDNKGSRASADVPHVPTSPPEDGPEMEVADDGMF